MNAILLGPPGSGKGTQAALLCRARGLMHVSTGDLLRAAVAAGTALGKEAKASMDRGELVPDRLVLALLRERLAGEAARDAAFLLDGFPRNVAQARALEAELGPGAVDHVVHLALDDDEILRRLLRRGRADDTEAVVRNRLEVYRAETRPLVEFYAGRGLLRDVDALGTVDEVAARVLAALGPAAGRTGRA